LTQHKCQFYSSSKKPKQQQQGEEPTITSSASTATAPLTPAAAVVSDEAVTTSVKAYIVIMEGQLATLADVVRNLERRIDALIREVQDLRLELQKRK
jgi:hypothetical protein